MNRTVTFGAPHLGNWQLASKLADSKHLRVLNKLDSVPFVVSMMGELNPIDAVIKTVGYRHVGQEAYFASTEIEQLTEAKKNEDGVLEVPIEDIVPLTRCKDSHSTCCGRTKDNLNKVKPSTMMNIFKSFVKSPLLLLKTHCYYMGENWGWWPKLYTPMYDCDHFCAAEGYGGGSLTMNCFPGRKPSCKKCRGYCLERTDDTMANVWLAKTLCLWHSKNPTCCCDRATKE